MTEPLTHDFGDGLGAVAAHQHPSRGSVYTQYTHTAKHLQRRMAEAYPDECASLGLGVVPISYMGGKGIRFAVISQKRAKGTPAPDLGRHAYVVLKDGSALKDDAPGRRAALLIGLWGGLNAGLKKAFSVQEEE